MRLQLRSIVAAVAVLFSLTAGHSAKAIDITFDLTKIAFYQPTSSLTSGGYTLLFSGVGNNLIGSVADGGLYMNSNIPFTITKTAGASDMIFKSYTMALVSYGSGNLFSFNLTGGTGTSNGNSFTQGATSNYNGSYSLVGSQTVTFNPVNFDPDPLAGDFVNFNALTFSVVPEPSTYALAAIATGVMAAIARRRKTRKA